MSVVKVSISTLAPIVLTKKIGDPFVTTSDDLFSGSVLLGIFVSEYKKRMKLPDSTFESEQFNSWFLRGGLRFSPAFFAVKDVFFPTPLSLHQNKEGDEIINLADVTADAMPEKKVVQVRGFCRFDETKLITAAPLKSNRFHICRQDRVLGHSRDGGLFQYEAIEQGQSFVGYIYGANDDLDNFKKLFGEGFEGFAGRSRTAEYGRIRITIGEIEQREEMNPTSPMDTGVITFVSPAILVNQNGYPDPSVSGVLLALQKLFKEKSCDVEDSHLAIIDKKLALQKLFEKKSCSIERCFIRTVTLESYVSQWGVRRSEMRALSAGSTITVKCPEGVNPEDFNKIMYATSHVGLGLRSGEGFGRFHWNLANKPTYTREILTLEGMKDKPPGTPTKLAIELFRSVVMDYLQDTIEKEALLQANDFAKNGRTIPGSLIGRLELILAENSTCEDFSATISQLKDTAKSSLRAIRDTDNKRTLLDHLLEEPNYEEKLKLPEAMKKIAEVAKWESPLSDKLLINELYRRYWQTFLRAARKASKDKERSIPHHDGTKH